MSVEKDSNYLEKKMFPYFDRSSTQIRTAKNLIKKALARLESFPENRELSEIDYQTITEIMSDCEMVALDLRKAIAEKGEEVELVQNTKTNSAIIKNREDFIKENGLNYDFLVDGKIKDLGMNNYPVEVNYDDGLLEVYTPLTFKKGFKSGNFMGNYLLAKYLQTSLIKWQNDHEFSFRNKIESPYICVMKRKNYKFTINKVCDADNLENQRIINMITETFNLPDNAKCMSLYSTWEQAKEEEREGMYFYLFSEKDLEKNIELLKSADINN